MCKIVVSSWNEWDLLKYVIVGCVDDCYILFEELVLDVKVLEDSDMCG